MGGDIMRERICQSCGMPLKVEYDYGTNSDGSKSGDYCIHCFQDGSFTDDEISLNGKIEKNVQFAIKRGFSESEARKMASDIIPRLKRWKKK
jgi:hypothetical protein